MRLLGILSVLVVVFSVGSLCYAQPQEEENVAYEKLKVLEPVIGTWLTSWDNAYTGKHVEVMTTYSWSPSQRMIVSKGKTRRVNIGEDIATQEWSDSESQISWMWNTASECIERYSIAPEMGMACVEKVVSKGEKSFDVVPIHGNHFLGTYTLTITATDKEIRNAYSNIKSPEGEKRDDVVLVSTRVARDGEK